MPVEIKELVLRAVAEEGRETAQCGDKTLNAQDITPETEAVIHTCVKQVLKILEKKKER